MRIRDPFVEGEEPYNLVPLTDMVFNLLIFFMCATTFVQVEKEMGLQLPKSGNVSAKTPGAGSANQLVINIRQNGEAVIAGVAYHDPKALAARISRAVAGRVGAVVIRADERSVVKYFAEVTRICRGAGVKEVKLVYVDAAEK